MISTKSIFSLLFFLTIGAGFVFSQHLMHYTSDRFEYSIQIPEDWRRNDQLKSENLAMVLVSPDEASLSVSFYSLKGMDKDVFIENFQNKLESQLAGIVIIEKGEFNARDDNAVYLMFDFEKEGVMYRERMSFYQNKKEMAVLSARQNKERFHELIPVIEQIYTSFTFETKQEKVDNLD